MVNVSMPREAAPPDYLSPIGVRTSARPPSPEGTPALGPPPDLPPVLLLPRPVDPYRRTPETPDLPEELLDPAVAPTSGPDGIPAPDLPGGFLQLSGPGGVAPPGPAHFPVGPARHRAVPDIPAVPGPDAAIPLSTDDLPLVDESTFEQRWDELSRRLQSPESVGDLSDPRSGGPIDLPPEFLPPGAEERDDSATDDDEG